MNTSAAPHCSFCLKSGGDVPMLIAGPNNVFICNECVGLCSRLVVESASKAIIARRNFSRSTPKETTA